VERAKAVGPHFLPGARMVAGGSTRLGGTRLGGRPDMPRGMRWPSCRGHLLVFGDLRETPDGLIQIELTYGRLHRRGCVQLRHVTGENLVRRHTPRRTRKLRSPPVGLRPTLTIPSLDGAEWLLRRPLRRWEAWLELPYRKRRGTAPRAACSCSSTPTSTCASTRATAARCT
jgi:hypothetical protein